MKRKERDQVSMRVSDNDGNIVTDSRGVKKRWKDILNGC